MKFFNKTSAGFLVRFALILSVSFAVILIVNFYLSDTEDPASLDREHSGSSMTETTSRAEE